MSELHTVLGRLRAIIRARVEEALLCARANGDLTFEAMPDFSVEKPREAEHGDFAVNAALLLAKPCHKAPREIAKLIAETIDFTASPIAKMEIAGPGFLNFRMQEGWLADVMAMIAAEGADFGKSDTGQGQRLQVEFVSANPTGDLHMGNARGAAIGDSLAGVLALAGFSVAREYYINDAGNQIDKFARTLEALYMAQLGYDFPFPEDGYPGADLPPLITALIARDGDKYAKMEENLRRECLADYGLQEKVAAIRKSLTKFGISYDCWFSERSLHDSGAVKATIQELNERGWLLEKEDALWLDCARMEGFDQEMKPEVLVRANGVPTYYAADIAYHKDKFDRGFTTVIDIWGADHHGHVARMQGAMEAMGFGRSQLEVILMQFVRLYQGGELVKMSKRTGQYVTLDELIEDVGCDAARFFFILRSADSLIDFDLDLAKAQTADNPVFYVQYAHARICSILRAAAEAGVTQAETADFSLLKEEAEQALIRKLADFPDVVASAALQREPHRLAGYLMELASVFHNFYGQCHCLIEDTALMQARLSLVRACAGVLKLGLSALGVSAPEKM